MGPGEPMPIALMSIFDTEAEVASVSMSWHMMSSISFARLGRFDFPEAQFLAGAVSKNSL